MKFLINNWAQISFILLALGYIIKVIFESIFKRREIKFNFFLNNRVKAIETFLSSYTNLESCYKDASTSYFNKTSTAKETDDIIVPLKNKLNDSLAILQLYTTTKEFESFTEVHDNFMTLMGKCSHLKHEAGINEITRGNHLYSLLRESKINNENLLNKLANQIQKDIRE